MSKGDYLGEFEHIVLLAILQLGADAYGMTVRREIESRTGRDVAIGAVYATLERLEAKGLVTCREEQPASGRAKRIYRVSAAGQRAREQTREALSRMMEGLA
jgi:DNA-binding PadR family transcriptional regulator